MDITVLWMKSISGLALILLLTLMTHHGVSSLETITVDTDDTLTVASDKEDLRLWCNFTVSLRTVLRVRWLDGHYIVAHYEENITDVGVDYKTYVKTVGNLEANEASIELNVTELVAKTNVTRVTYKCLVHIYNGTSRQISFKNTTVIIAEPSSPRERDTSKTTAAGVAGVSSLETITIDTDDTLTVASDIEDLRLWCNFTVSLRTALRVRWFNDRDIVAQYEENITDVGADYKTYVKTVGNFEANEASIELNVTELVTKTNVTRVTYKCLVHIYNGTSSQISFKNTTVIIAEPSSPGERDTSKTTAARVAGGTVPLLILVIMLTSYSQS